MKSFAIKLKEERMSNSFTQKKMAELLGINLRAYQNYESTGINHREPDQELLIKIANILDVSIDYLLGIVN